MLKTMFRFRYHMWLVDHPNPCELEQSWEWIFLKEWTLVNTKWGLKHFFINGLLRNGHFKIWRPLKQTKSKNGHHFFISTFENLQLCFFVQKDSSTLKVLKMQFVFGWAIIRNIADWICNVPYRRLSQRQIAFLGPLEWRNLFGQKKQSCKFSKVDVMK